MNDSVKISKRLVALSEEIVKADQDYVYDPDHKNRPHDGQTWYETNKGWTTNQSNGDSKTNNSPTKLDLAKNSSSPEDLKQLAMEQDDNVKVAAFANPHMPPDVLSQASRSDQIIVKEAVASNPSTPVSDLERMCEYHLDSRTALALAKNPSSSNKIIKILATKISPSKYPSFRDAISTAKQRMEQAQKQKKQENEKENENRFSQLSRQEQMLEIAKSHKDSLKVKLPSLPDITDEALLILSKDKNPEVRQSVAEKPNCPNNILQSLSNDPLPEIRKTVAWNKTVDPSLIEKLSKDSDAEVRRAVAMSPQTPPEILESLSKDESARVLIMVAKNPNCPKTVFENIQKSNPDWFNI